MIKAILIFILIILLIGAMVAYWEFFLALLIVGAIGFFIYYFAVLKPKREQFESDRIRKEKAFKDQVDKAIENKTKVNYPSEIQDYHVLPILRAIQNRLISNAKYIKQTNGYEGRINDVTLQTFSQYADSENVKEYSFVEISRSSNEFVKPGSYIYKFDNEGNLFLLRSTFHLIGEHAFYDASLETQAIKIENKMIKTYNQQGTELMKTEITSTPSMNNPSLLKTATSELLFGTSYTLLKGMKQNQATISSKSTIHDTRNIQLILEDKSDIVFEGIAIFYDVARFVEKRSQEVLPHRKQDLIANEVKQIEANKTVVEKLKELKELLDDKVITEEEFEKLKKDLLN